MQQDIKAIVRIAKLSYWSGNGNPDETPYGSYQPVGLIKTDIFWSAYLSRLGNPAVGWIVYVFVHVH